MSKTTNDRLKGRFLLTKHNCINQLITNKTKQHAELYHSQPCMSIKSQVSANLIRTQSDCKSFLFHDFTFSVHPLGHQPPSGVCPPSRVPHSARPPLVPGQVARPHLPTAPPTSRHPNLSPPPNPNPSPPPPTAPPASTLPHDLTCLA